jgi:predicted transcriptional regulator of viral defense system
MEDFIVFDLSDIRIYEPDFNLVQLTQWRKKGYIKKIIKGKYILSHIQINEQVKFLIANELLAPSYVSLEMALSWHGLIPEGVYSITSVSTRRSIQYETELGSFGYRKIKEEAFWGDIVYDIPNMRRGCRIASIEKALIDFLYYKYSVDTKEDIEGLRLNEEVLGNDVNWGLLVKYAELVDNKALLDRVRCLIKYYHKDDYIE